MTNEKPDPVEPEPCDMAAAVQEYCLRQGLDLDEVTQRMRHDDAFAMEMYRLAQAAKLIRLYGNEKKDSEP